MSAGDEEHRDYGQAAPAPQVDGDKRERHGLHAVDDVDNELAQLRVAMEHRTVIGQAQGILMAQLDIDADQAFTYLRRESMDRNRKVYDLAQEVAVQRHPLEPA